MQETSKREEGIEDQNKPGVETEGNYDQLAQHARTQLGAQFKRIISPLMENPEYNGLDDAVAVNGIVDYLTGKFDPVTAIDIALMLADGRGNNLSFAGDILFSELPKIYEHLGIDSNDDDAKQPFIHIMQGLRKIEPEE